MMILKIAASRKTTLYKWSFLLLLCFLGSGVRAESIENFSTVNTIRTDGTVLVEESIVYDFEGVSRHGIFRLLETGHPQAATREFHRRFIGIDVKNVTVNNQPVPYKVSGTEEVMIKIGDPDTYVTGKHEYKITYELTGALSYGSEGAEFYYNVTGMQWEVPIKRVVAVVVGEREELLKDKSYCYRGAAGSKDACDEIDSAAEGTTFAANSLPPFAGLTIAQQVDEAQVAHVVVEQPVAGQLGEAGVVKPVIEHAPWLWQMWVVVLVFGTGLFLWSLRFRSSNQAIRPVIAQYEPYEGFLPMYTGFLFDNRLDPQDVTAGIVYLAEQGFISIRKTDKKILWVFSTTDYEVTLKKPQNEIPSIFLTKISELLFEESAPLQTTVLLSVLARKPQTNARLLKELRESLRSDLKAQGFLESEFEFVMGAALRSFALVWTAVLASFWLLGVFEDSNWLQIVVPLVFSLIVTGFQLPVATYNRRSKKSYEALNHLEGFKLFLSVTDKDRFSFHNAPDKNPEVFMKYLPYAIAFKVEKEWAKVFEGITIPNPSWYDGGSVGAFSAAAFTSDLSSFSSSFSSSSGTSGSSGGGFSGGGGGGGGGGSW